MSGHPSFAIGDVLLRRYDVYAPSIVVTGYDASSRMLIYEQPKTNCGGIGSHELYIRAPEGWQDAPQPADYASHLADFHRARIAWAQRHLIRIDTGLAVEELSNARAQLRSLESAA